MRAVFSPIALHLISTTNCWTSLSKICIFVNQKSFTALLGRPLHKSNNLAFHACWIHSDRVSQHLLRSFLPKLKVLSSRKTNHAFIRDVFASLRTTLFSHHIVFFGVLLAFFRILQFKIVLNFLFWDVDTLENSLVYYAPNSKSSKFFYLVVTKGDLRAMFL